MNKPQWLALALVLAVLGAMSMLIVDQRQRIFALERELQSKAARTDGTNGAVNTGADVALQLSALTNRIAVVEQRISTAPATWSTTVTPPSDPPSTLATAITTSPNGAAPTPDPVLAEAVKNELARAEQAREQERNERLRARTREKLDAFAKAHALSGDQTEKLTTMVDAEQQEIRGLFRDARDSGDFATTREQARAVRQKTEENAKAILDEDQFEAFVSTRQEERQRFFGGEPPAP